MYPLFGSFNNKLNFLTLSEAMEQGGIEIKELGEGGSVPDLILTNNCSTDVMVIAGEELVGAKQNRTVNVSLMAGTGTSLNIPVSCTERGRWHEGSKGPRTMQSSTYCSTATLRSTLVRTSGESLELKRTYRSDQSAIWNAIRDTASHLGVSSRTEAQSDIFAKKRMSIDDIMDQFHCYRQQTGMICRVNGKVVSIDLCGNADVFGRVYDKLISSLAVEALAQERLKTYVSDSKFPADFLEDLKKANVTRYEAPGRGEHWRLTGALQSGMALVVEGSLVHLCSFPN